MHQYPQATTLAVSRDPRQTDVHENLGMVLKEKYRMPARRADRLTCGSEGRTAFPCLRGLLGIVLLFAASRANAEPAAAPLTAFFRTHCVDCHSGEVGEGGLDLENLRADFTDAELLRRWVRIHD